MDQPMPTGTKPRIIIMRHSERLDSVLRNSDWPSEAFVNGVYSPNLTLLPARLPLRSNPQSYLLDTTLTKYGKAHAYYTGEFFRSLGLFPRRVYTSPAMRCVQTADSVLDGLGQRDRTPLRIDLALHEPSRRELPIESEQFYSSADFYVDLIYRPSLSADEKRVIVGETRLQYYCRMHAFIKRITEDILTQPVPLGSSSTNLIVTHRSCVTLLAAMLNLDTIDEQLNYLYNIESNKRREVNFLAMIIAEYDASLGLWTFLSDFPSLPERAD